MFKQNFQVTVVAVSVTDNIHPLKITLHFYKATLPMPLVISLRQYEKYNNAETYLTIQNATSGSKELGQYAVNF